MNTRPLWWRLAWDKTPEPAPDDWKPSDEWWENDRRVAFTELFLGVQISTVFLALDHSFGEGPPILFETMIFGGSFDQTCWRYATWQEAVEGHEKAVQYAYTQFTGETDIPKSLSRGRSIISVSAGQHGERAAEGESNARIEGPSRDNPDS
jgi:hypothetical protein